jgi:GrpB-like predicted nucleotidyltransferase (UPF0157 family)
VNTDQQEVPERVGMDADGARGAHAEAAHADERDRPQGRIVIVDYDPVWAGRYLLVAERIRSALGAGALSLEHVGSTAVPGLAAKPIVDINLVVADSSREELYVPLLETVGFHLVVREPGWFEHRMLRSNAPAVNLHVFSSGCPEVDRMRAFRDRLRGDARDRQLYEHTKRRLAEREWAHVQDYADAKRTVIDEIMSRPSG